MTIETQRQNMYAGWSCSAIVVGCVRTEVKLVSAHLVMLEFFLILQVFEVFYFNQSLWFDHANQSKILHLDIFFMLY